MPPKRGAGGHGGGGGGGGGKGGAAKVALGERGQEQILAVVQGALGQGQPPLQSSGAAGVDLDSKKLARRLEGLVERLQGLGFREGSIDRCLQALCLGGGGGADVSLERALDWLCLNLSADELPAQFNDAGANEARRTAAAKVDVGHAGAGRLGEAAARGEVEYDVSGAVEAMAAKAREAGWTTSADAGRGKGGVEVDKDWILNYAAREAEAERAAAAAAKAQASAAARWEAMTPEEKLERLEASFAEESRKAKEGKESGRLGRRERAEMEARLRDIREQISELRVIVGQRKREMKRLKEQLLADMQQQDQQQQQPQSSSAAPADQPAKGRGQDQDDGGTPDFGGMFGDEDEEEEEEQPPAPQAAAHAHAPAKPAKDEAGFEKSVVSGMFGDSDSDEEDDDAAAAAAAELEARRRERREAMAAAAAKAAAAPASSSAAVEPATPMPARPPTPPSPDRAMPENPVALEPSETAGKQKGGGAKKGGNKGKPAAAAATTAAAPAPAPMVAQGKALQVGVPKNWSGKTPRRLLEEHLQKRKLGRAAFQRPSSGGRDASNGCILTLKLAATAPASGGSKGAAREQPPLEADTELRFESVGEFAGHADAQHAAATRALYHLEPRLQLQRILPPPFRDWWREWTEEDQRKREEAAAAVRQGKKDRIQSLVQSMKEVQLGGQQQPQQEEEQGQGPSTSFGLPDASELSWEEQAEGMEEADDAGNGEQATSQQEAVPGGRGRRQRGKGEEAGKEEDAAAGERLRQRFEATRRRAEYQALAAKRAELPVAATREEILACIAREQVVVISGETGCGKSTQVAQFILEEALLRGEGHRVNLVCTQPRRVAAVSLAERVAQEMGDSGGAGARDGLVGYQIRMEAKTSASTRLTFCTTGILLRKLQTDPLLEQYSHIILDEVHERQALGDFLLIVLRDLLPKRRGLRLVLMSATVNQELFCRYMGGCPAFAIPGRYFPVQERYLEDVLEATGHFVEEGSPYCRRDMRAQFKSTTVEVSGRGGNSYAQRLEWAEEAAEAEGRRGPGWVAFMDQCREEGYGAMTLKSLGRVDETALNPDLIEDLLKHVVEAEAEHVARGDPGWREDGAVLVFLPGLGEIRGLLERLQAGRLFRDERRFWLLPLHSALSSAEQQRVFQRPPRGVRKIILSTNIAETSVTIDDVAYVVDCGLVKEAQLASRGRGGGRALVTTWCCRASAKQRMGRAGRVAPGVCFRLFSRYTHEKVMDEFAVPELQRTPLEELCLQIRSNKLAPSCRAFLGQAPEPPDPVAVDAAVRVLQEVGALARREGAAGAAGAATMEGDDGGEGELTPLGVHLAKLPVDVRIGKMLVLASLFHCLDPVLTIAAALSGTKSPFLAPLGKEQEARAAHAKFEVRQSDFLTLAHAFAAYRAACRERKEQAFCAQHFLGRVTLREVGDLKCQYLSLLVDMGLVARPPHFGTRGGGVPHYAALEEFMASPEARTATKAGGGVNAEAGNINLVLAVVAAGLYPHVVFADTGHTTGGGGGGGRACFYHGPPTKANAQVYLHPSSVNHGLASFSSPWLVFHEKFHTTRAYVSPTSVVSPYALLLFGGPLAVDHLGNRVVIDEWIEFSCPARTAVLFKEMRKRLNEVLEDMIQRPLIGAATPAGEVHAAVVDAIVSLLKQEEVKAAWVPGSKDDPDVTAK